MARAAKKQNKLTPEEKLAQALVPVEEQPYPIPENWCWTYLTKGVAECKDSYRKPINANERAKRIGDIPYYGATGQVGWIDDYLTDDELVLLGEDGAPFLDLMKDKAYIIFGKAWVNNHVHILKSFFGHVGNIYLLNYLNMFNYTGYVNGTTRLKLSQSNMDTIPVPVAPLAEQQRIIDRIENLFAKLDEAKEKAQAVVNSFEDRKAAILHKAFSGELTKKWREENRISMATWQEARLDDVCDSIFDGDHMPPPKADAGVPFIVISDVNTGYLSFNNTRFVPQEYYNSISDTRKPELGDVLYTLVGSYGIPVVVDDEKDFCFQRHIALLKPSCINSYYLWYQLQSPEFYKKASDIATGTAQQTVPIRGLRKLTIALPKDNEQEQIVCILDSLLFKEKRLKGNSERVLEQIDTLKKSILVRAFRGELGTNDPDDENAIELLQKVLEIDTPPLQRKKGLTIPKELSTQLKTELEKKIVKLYFQKNVDCLSINDVMKTSSKPFDVLEALYNLEERKIIIKTDDKHYRLVREVYAD